MNSSSSSDASSSAASNASVTAVVQSISNFDIYVAQSLGIAISFPSVLLYIVECTTIIKHWKHFNSSFYKLFLLSAINNLLMNFGPSILYVRLIRLGWINDFYLNGPKWMPNALTFIMYYNYHCENLATIFTLIHRLTAVANPLRNEQQWRLILPFAAMCIFLGPLLFTYRLLVWPLAMTTNPDRSVEIGLDKSRIADKPTFTNFMMMLATSLGYLLVNIVLNLLVYICYKRTQAKFTLMANDRSNRLLVYALAIFLAQLLLCLFWAFGNLFSPTFNLMLSNQYVWMSDIRTVAFPAWFLLWASTDLREQIRKNPLFAPFCCLCCSNAVGATPNNNNNTRMVHTLANGVKVSMVGAAWSSTNNNNGRNGGGGGGRSNGSMAIANRAADQQQQPMEMVMMRQQQQQPSFGKSKSASPSLLNGNGRIGGRGGTPAMAAGTAAAQLPRIETV